MTVTYRTTGKLTAPVTNLNEARKFLKAEESNGMTGFIWADRRAGVHSVSWDLINESEWEVTLVADHPLEEEQLRLLSEWISGQNSDGLGEGFEQQSFAEREGPIECDCDFVSECTCDSEYIMSSFDWQDNPCELVKIQ